MMNNFYFLSDTEKSSDKINVCSLAKDNEHKVDFTNSLRSSFKNEMKN